MKILIISSIPTHPTTAGNCNFIKKYCTLLKQMGYDIYFLYVVYYAVTKQGRKNTEIVIEEMKKYWNDHCFVYRASLFDRFIEEIRKKYRVFRGDNYRSCDEHYLGGFHKYVNTLHRIHNFDACIINYYWFSKLFTKISIKRQAIITHDSFTYYNLRTGAKSALNLKPNEEAKALQRCPFIFAMQDEERIFFQRLAPQSKVLVSYCNYDFIELPKVDNHNIVMLSAAFYWNINGLIWFVEKVFPLILQDYPDCRLKIGGNINTAMLNYKNHRNIDFLGFIEDAADLYKFGDVAINPTYQGTGLKIKTFESIAYNKITMVHPHSTIGIYDKEHAPLFVSDNPNDWIAFLHKVWDNPTYADEIRAKNKNYIYQLNQFIINQFKTFLQ